MLSTTGRCSAISSATQSRGLDWSISSKKRCRLSSKLGGLCSETLPDARTVVAHRGALIAEGNTITRAIKACGQHVGGDYVRSRMDGFAFPFCFVSSPDSGKEQEKAAVV